ncbi:MAG: helix-turn-helix transcriptional regulator [Bacteroidales bacterium]|nr:helix-turn-helix transcriptional regulator [Bacteroidales bacterium]
MKTIESTYKKIVGSVPDSIKQEVDWEIAVSNKIADLMQNKGLSKKEFAMQMGKNPSEITKWLSGQHNFTLRTIAEISAFFNQPMIKI